MFAEFCEGSVERLDVGVCEESCKVLFDAVPVVTACFFHGSASFVGEDDEDRASVDIGRTRRTYPSRSSRSTTRVRPLLRIEDPLGQLVHPQAFGVVLDVDEHVVGRERQLGVALELGFQDVVQRERGLKVQLPCPETFRRRA